MAQLTAEHLLALGTTVAELPNNLRTPPGKYSLEYNGYEMKDGNDGAMMLIVSFRILGALEVDDQALAIWEKASGSALVGSDYTEMFYRSEAYAKLWASNVADFALAMGVTPTPQTKIGQLLDAIVMGTRLTVRIENSTTKKGKDIDSLNVKSIAVA